uniref:Uncharacterized protein n=1 Tax=Zea mays TaxID=4577 RepID=C0HE01_MAIZE|nr:unknown [Zea mays]
MHTDEADHTGAQQSPGRPADRLRSLRLRLRDGLLQLLQGRLVPDEAHEPEVEAVARDDLHVLVLRPVPVLARPGRRDPAQRDGHLVRHPQHRRRAAAAAAAGRRRQRQRQRAVAPERDPLGGHEQHAGDRAGRGRQVALRRPEQPLAAPADGGGEPAPEHLPHAARPQDPRPQRQLALHGLVQLRAQRHCKHGKSTFSSVSRDTGGANPRMDGQLER